MVQIPIGSDFVAVPYDAVTLNGIHLPQLNTFAADYQGPWALISLQHNRAVDGEDGRRPYRYADLSDCYEDAENLRKRGDYSVCS